MKRIAFIGLGTMGYAMAGHLQKNRHHVCVFNRTISKAQAWQQQYGGRIASSPRDAAQQADYVFLCVGNDNDVREVVFGEQGVLAGMASGDVLIDHSTVSPTLARELNEACQQQACGFIDAPVSGGSEGAKNGQLTIMCGGDATLFEKVRPLLMHYARKTTLIGPAGSGQAAKMINQVCVVGVLQSLAEGLALADSLHLDIARVIEAISEGAAGSWQMSHRWQAMLTQDFTPGFAAKWMLKDLNICLSEAKHQGLDLPLSELLLQRFKQLTDMGHGNQDITQLIRLLHANNEHDDSA